MDLSWTSLDPISPQWTRLAWTSLDPIRPQWTCLGPHWTLLDLNGPAFDLIWTYQTSMDLCLTSLDPIGPQWTCL